MIGNRAVCYTRVSTPKQATFDRESLPAQERACRAYAADQHFEVVRVYVEPGFTATKTERPVFSQLVKDAQTHSFEHLIIDRTDRLTRGGPGHYEVLVERLRQEGVQVHFATEHFDPNTDVGDLMGVIYAFQAKKDNERRVLLRKRTFERKARDGHYVCGKRPPYGYRFPEERKPDGRLKKDRLVADPITGPIVRHLFDAVARGATLRSQAIRLNQEHVPTPTGRPAWSIPILSILLRKPIYYGEAGVTLAGEHFKYPEGVVGPLIDAETAAVVQTRLAQNRKYSLRTANVSAQPVLIGGRGRCAHCGHALATRQELTRQGKPRVAYWCQWGKLPRTCPGVWALAKEVDQVVWDQLRDYLLNPDKLAALAEQQAQAELNDDPSSEVHRMRQLLAEATRKRDNLYAAIGETDNKTVRAGLLL
jgi:site-specific DNA recombinase